MIRYQLRCDAEHEFEGWFRSGADYDAQAADGLLECPACGSTAIRKAIMAPAIARRRAGRKDAAREVIEQAAARAREYIHKNFDYVGDRFPEEARKIHYGEVKERNIYGEATGDEVKTLVEEGVSIAPMPGAAPRDKTAGPVRPAGRIPKKSLN